MAALTARLARPGRLAVVVLALLGTALGPLPGAVRAADAATFGSPSGSSTYGKQIRFVQPVTFASAPRRVEVLVGYPGAAGPLVVDETAEARNGPTELTYDVPLDKGSILPNTVVTARWRVVGADGSTSLGPAVSVTYADDRFHWQTESGDVVRIHWYDGDAAFGRRALAIAEDGVAKAEDLLGVRETEPIDFFVYADQQAFYDALGPGTRENVGGEAVAEIRTLFGLITPDEVNASWVGIVIPHELTHLVFDTAVHNPYHFPPRWLNEGLAVYLSQSYDADDRRQVEGGARDGSLMPLTALGGQFPTTQDRFYLAYAESVSSVDFLVRTYGRDALVGLIRSYSTGLTDDEAFGKALGVDVAGFERAWLGDVGAATPKRYGPQPAPPGPVPSAWAGANAQAPGGASGASSAAAPTAAAGAPAARTPGSSGGGWTTAVALTVAGVAAVALLALAAFERRRRARPADGPSAPPDPPFGPDRWDAS